MVKKKFRRNIFYLGSGSTTLVTGTLPLQSFKVSALIFIFILSDFNLSNRLFQVWPSGQSDRSPWHCCAEGPRAHNRRQQAPDHRQDEGPKGEGETRLCPSGGERCQGAKPHLRWFRLQKRSKGTGNVFNSVFRIHIHQIRIRLQPKISIRIRIQKGLESGSGS